MTASLDDLTISAAVISGSGGIVAATLAPLTSVATAQVANDLYVSGGGEAEATLGPLTATASMVHFIQNRSEPAALLI